MTAPTKDELLRAARQYVACTHMHHAIYIDGVLQDDPCARCALRDQIDAALAETLPELRTIKESQHDMASAVPAVDGGRSIPSGLVDAAPTPRTLPTRLRLDAEWFAVPPSHPEHGEFRETHAIEVEAADCIEQFERELANVRSHLLAKCETAWQRSDEAVARAMKAEAQLDRLKPGWEDSVSAQDFPLVKNQVLSLVNRICHIETEYFQGRCPIGGFDNAQGKLIDELLALCAPSAIRNTLSGAASSAPSEGADGASPSGPAPTPRTDAAAIHTPAPVPFKGEFVRVEFAQKLERELGAMILRCAAADRTANAAASSVGALDHMTRRCSAMFEAVAKCAGDRFDAINEQFKIEMDATRSARQDSKDD